MSDVNQEQIISIDYVRYSANNEGTSLLDQMVDCYREVFASAPWSEWLKCQICEERWGIEEREVVTAANFLHCTAPLVDFWPKERVAEDMRREISPDSSCWLAMNDGRVVGFCWGYPIRVGDLENKLGLSLETPALTNKELTVSYLDEVGVMKDYRDRKIAKSLMARYVRDAKERGIEFDIARVKRSPEPSITYLWYTQKLGYEIVAAYPEKDGRVILGRPLTSLAF